MKIVLLSVGKMKNGALKEVCAEYLARLKRYGPAEVLEVKAAEGLVPDKAVELECERLLNCLEPADTVWILDEKGKQFTSVELADGILKLEINSIKRLVLILGGAYGLNSATKKRGANIALSKMTLPHELCRAIALEQLYRARTIQRGEPYHHA
jgi:23S rRNA (pseudouridine1915-N3)-methyltransferase